MASTGSSRLCLFTCGCILSGLFGTCAVAPAMGSPISVNPDETYRLRFTGFWVPFDNTLSSKLNSSNIQSDIANELKRQGYNIEGGKGSSSQEGTRFKLSAMAKELNCVGRSERSCEIEVMWEVWDTRRSTVVYRVRTWATELKIKRDDRIPGIKRLVIKSLHSLLSRTRFVQTVSKIQSNLGGSPKNTPKYDDAVFMACKGAPLRMPEDAKSALAATTLIKSGQSVGSGVSISPDGFVLTAAHVVNGSRAKIIFQDGKEYEAYLVRKNRKRDVALLKMKGTGYSCLNYRKDPGRIGEKIYAIGSPASEELAFSLTTGIISAERNWNNDTYLQTDASINPGNSGGPLLDEEGNILATVSWKLVGIGVEGIGFGVPIGAALTALSITPGEASSSVLSQEEKTPKGTVETTQNAVEDTPDEKQDLLPKGIRSSSAIPDWRRPFRHITRWTGVAILTAGVVLTTVSYLKVKIASNKEEDDYDHMKYSEYKRWITLNRIGWVLAPVGAALYITSFIVKPKKESEWSGVRGRFFGNAATLEVRF